MSFFDELGKKITDASRNAVEKTKDLAEITRLNSVIKENEAEVDAIYAELGELYYKSHCNDKAPEFADEIQKISALIAETDECRENILDLKGLAKCPYCGAEFSSDETECPECGKAVARAAVKTTDRNGDERLICSVCGYHMRPGSNFCIMCGTPVKKTDDAPTSTATTSTAQNTDPPADTVKIPAHRTAATAAEKETAAPSVHDERQTIEKFVPDFNKNDTKFDIPAVEDAFADTPVEVFSAPKNDARPAAPTSVSQNNGETPSEPDYTDDIADAIAAKAAAEISRMTAEKIAARKMNFPETNFSEKTEMPTPARTFAQAPAKETARTPARDSASAELPDFDAIDDSLVVEEQTISDSPAADKNIPFRRPVSRPSINGNVCRTCGSPLPDGALFCTRCGAKCVAETKTPTVCPGCGAFIGKGVTFCPECGMKLGM